MKKNGLLITMSIIKEAHRLGDQKGQVEPAL